MKRLLGSIGKPKWSLFNPSLVLCSNFNFQVWKEYISYCSFVLQKRIHKKIYNLSIKSWRERLCKNPLGKQIRLLQNIIMSKRLSRYGVNNHWILLETFNMDIICSPHLPIPHYSPIIQSMKLKTKEKKRLDQQYTHRNQWGYSLNSDSFDIEESFLIMLTLIML